MLRILFIILFSNCAFAQSQNSAWVSSLHWSADNKLLYSTSYDSSIRVWSVQSGSLVNTLRTDQLVMTSSLSPDGKKLAAHLSEGDMELWDMANRKKLAAMSIRPKGNFGSWFSADSKTLLTGNLDEDDLTISLWNANTGERIDQSRTYTIINYAVSPDARRYLTLSAAHHIIIWDGASLKPLQDKLLEKDIIQQILISPDNTSFGILTSKGIKLFNMNTMDSIAMIPAGDRSIRSFSFDPGNKYIVTIAYNGDVDCWIRASGKFVFLLGNYGKQDYGWMARVVYDKTGKRVAISYDANKISVWDLQKKKKIMQAQGDKHLLLPSFNKAGNKLLLSEGYNGISTWYINTGKKWKEYHQ